jgi:hypothetical protein
VRFGFALVVPERERGFLSSIAAEVRVKLFDMLSIHLQEFGVVVLDGVIMDDLG